MKDAATVDKIKKLQDRRNMIAPIHPNSPYYQSAQAQIMNIDREIEVLKMELYK